MRVLYRGIALLLFAGACRPSQPDRSQQTTLQTVTTAAPAQDTFAATTATPSRPAPAPSPPAGSPLHAVRTDSQPGSDHPAFAVAGASLPAYPPDYATR